MKNLFYLFLILIVALSCRNNERAVSRQDKKITRQAVAAAEDYAKGHISDPVRAVTEQGIIVLSDSISRILIDPSKIVTGDFEGDTLTDAIIPMYFFKGQNQDITINLFLVNNEGNLMTVRALEDNMKVLSVMKRVIYIELPVKSTDIKNPGAQGKTEVIEFVFMADSLRRYSSSTDSTR
jgi:predicted RNA-binding protein (virulence factor B family)